MSANRINITFSTVTSKKSKATLKTPVPLHPEYVDNAVDNLSQFLHNLANDKKTLKILLEGFAQGSYEEYKKWYNDFHRIND